MEKKQDLMEEIAEKIRNCKKCGLCETRNLTVPGLGNIDSPLVFIGEGPGADEDNAGIPFVGAAGKLLTDILKAAKIEREEIFISNIVKCRPPKNRVPLQEEMDCCYPFLLSQLAVIQPKLLITLGSTALGYLLGEKKIAITKLRGQTFPWKGETKIFSMFHPSYLLRNPSKEKGSPKSLTWEDIKEVRKLYDEYRQEN